MIFSELYSAYYNAVAAVLRAACDHPLTRGELRQLVTQNAFGESLLNIEPALLDGRWPLIRADGTALLRHSPTMPLTLLERRWLKAITLDPRVRLFPDVPDMPDTEPLFTPDDYCVFDRYSDGDPYTDEAYIATFRQILTAIEAHQPLFIESVNRHGEAVGRVMLPDHLEYSEKDDKFRMISGQGVVNLGRIRRCEPANGNFAPRYKAAPEAPSCTVVAELTNRRNSLERVLLHFAHFEKQVEQLENGSYRLTIVYRKPDELEMVIRMLSFGPMLKVIAPDTFVELIKDRLRRQLELGGL